MKKIIALLLVVWTTATAANIAAPKTIVFNEDFTMEKLAEAIMSGSPVGDGLAEELEPVWAEYETLPLPSLGEREPAVDWLICALEGEEFFAFVQHQRTWWGGLKLYRVVIKKDGLWQEAGKEAIKYMQKHRLIPAIDYE